jgi:hypothetical protein
MSSIGAALLQIWNFLIDANIELPLNEVTLCEASGLILYAYAKSMR